jgi:hyaluronoglucosaminidase
MSQVRVRGVVEGFYGPLYSFAQRRDLFRFLAAAGLNTYVYAPKNDPYHREEWRVPYPADVLEHFRDLAQLGPQIGVRFVFAISPGLTFDPTSADAAALEHKLRSIFDLGVRDFCLLFDDIDPSRPAADPTVQTDVVIDMHEYLKAWDPRSTLAFISNFYAGTAAQFAEDRTPFARLFSLPSSAYFTDYARIPADVPIMWTGPAVFSEHLRVADARAMRDYVGRPLWVWDNYPVNDALVMNELFLGPYAGREAGLGSALDGVLVNPMLQAEATKIPLWTIAQFFRDEDGYDPDAAWTEALTLVTEGQGTEVVRTLAQQFQSHPYIGDTDESTNFADAVARFWEERSPRAETALRRLLTDFAANRARLDAEVRNRALVAELIEPATKLSLFGEAGLLGFDLLAARRRGEVVDVAELQTRLTEANAIRWLVGANTAPPPALGALIASRPAKPADVFGTFFERVAAELSL